MSYAVFAPEPERIVAPVLEVGHIAANQCDFVIVITIGKVIDETLKCLATRFHALGFKVHGTP